MDPHRPYAATAWELEAERRREILLPDRRTRQTTPAGIGSLARMRRLLDARSEPRPTTTSRPASAR